MLKPPYITIWVYFALWIILFTSCIPNRQEADGSSSPIKIRESSEPSSINPFYIRDEIGFYVAGQIFQPLLAIDYKSEKLVGVLAQDRPTITSSQEWKMIITYQLRKNITFSNGSPLGFNDILYSIKANISPLINPYYNSYYQFIDSVSVDEADSSRFSIYSNDIYYLSEFTSGDYFILSEQQFDPNFILRNYSLTSLKQLNEDSSSNALSEYAKFVEAFTFKDSIQPLGTGAYSLKSWNSNFKLSLSRNDNWWGKSLSSNSVYFKSNTPEIEMHFIEDATTAVNALKNGEFDLMRSIPPKNYHELKNNSIFQSKFRLDSAKKFAYQYLGFNLRNEHLRHISLRKAIAFSFPKAEIIDKLYYGMAEPIFKLEEFDNSIDTKPWNSYQTNNDSALFYLKQFQEASSQNDIELVYAYNSGNDNRKAVGLILKEVLKQIGITVSIEQYEWSVYLQKLKGGEFDLFFNGSVTSSFTPDLSNSLHSSSINGGRNYFGFEDPISDSLLEAISSEQNEMKRQSLFENLEHRINNQLPFLLAMRPYEAIAFSRELKNANAYRLRPNYWAAEMSK